MFWLTIGFGAFTLGWVDKPILLFAMTGIVFTYYTFIKQKKLTDLSTLQNDIIITNIKKTENSEASARLKNALCEAGWL